MVGPHEQHRWFRPRPTGRSDSQQLRGVPAPRVDTAAEVAVAEMRQGLQPAQVGIRRHDRGDLGINGQRIQICGDEAASKAHYHQPLSWPYL